MERMFFCSGRRLAHKFICSKRGFCKYNWSYQRHFITRWMCLCEHENFHSVNLQVSCDAQIKLTKTVARWPGSMNNSFILTNMMGNRLQAGPMQDGDYSCGINHLFFGQKSRWKVLSVCTHEYEPGFSIIIHHYFIGGYGEGGDWCPNVHSIPNWLGCAKQICLDSGICSFISLNFCTYRLFGI